MGSCASSQKNRDSSSPKYGRFAEQKVENERTAIGNKINDANDPPIAQKMEEEKNDGTDKGTVCSKHGEINGNNGNDDSMGKHESSGDEAPSKVLQKSGGIKWEIEAPKNIGKKINEIEGEKNVGDDDADDNDDVDEDDVDKDDDDDNGNDDNDSDAVDDDDDGGSDSISVDGDEDADAKNHKEIKDLKPPVQKSGGIKWDIDAPKNIDKKTENEIEIPCDDSEEDGKKLEKFELQIKEEEKDKTNINISILNGQVNIEIPSQVKLVRIFTSSTFTDTFVERNTLMEKVYRRLKEYCQLQGYDFQVVDMRWGVRDEATDDHMTSELCMKELKACQKLSTGPNFITFLSQKYGYRPFPAKIFEKEFDVMLSSIENKEDVDLLEKWFIRDDNLTPSMYILQPIRDLLPNYNNWDVTAEERAKASNDWWKAFERMQVILRDAAEKTLINEEEISRYKISVTEDEVRRGIMDVKDKKKHCFWFRRRITDIENQLDKNKSRFFIDKIGKCLDEDAVSLLDDLRQKVQTVLTDENVRQYAVKWHGEDGINAEENEDHSSYINQLCSDFYEVLVDMINKGIEEKAEQSLDNGLLNEISEHAITCQEKSKTFYGRNEVLDSIVKHVDGANQNRVLIVHGESGCGKTSIMAVAARKIKDLHPEIPVVLRFLGTTSESSTIHDLLRSVCTQIYQIISKEQPEFPEIFQEVVEYFEKTLKMIKTKMVIILDSLDQLSLQDRAFNLKWLPKKINRNLSFILSTIPDVEYKVFPVLEARFPREYFIEVPKMEKQSAGFILNAWLRIAGHKLTSKQKETVLNAFNHCPLPLFLKLSFDQSLKWRSYSPEDKTVLPLTVKEVINSLFANLERLHGKCLVRRSLGYLTAAKFGLSDAEMEDILSIDDEVLNDVYQYWTPPFRRIPPLLWIRIKSDLDTYVVSRGVDGLLVNTWYHRQFFETAKERYLQPESAKVIHGHISDYFQGKWAGGVRKPFVSKQGKVGEQDRLVSTQPNVFTDQSEGSSERFNHRKLNELPYHLTKAGNVDALRENFTSNFDFLQTKLRANGLRDLLLDLKEAAKALPNVKEIELIGKCIEMSGKALLDDPYQLAGQLTSRMSHLEEDYSGIKTLLEQARKASVKCLYPPVTCFPGPGGPLLHTLSGHRSLVNWACLSKDGSKLVSISEDETLKVWDIADGEEIQSYQMDTDYSDVRFYNNDDCVIVAGSYGMFGLELSTERIVYQEEDVSGLHGKCIDVIDDGRALIHMGEERIRVYHIVGQDIEFAWEYEGEAVDKSEGIADIVSGSRDLYAYTRGDERELTIRNAFEKEFEKKHKAPYGLRHFQFHENKLVSLGTNSEFQQLTKMHLVIWDTSSWDIILDKESQFHPMISTMYDVTITKMSQGFELIWPVLNQINFWNLETGKERATLRMGLQGGSYKQAICNDGKRLVVTEADINKLALHIYDLDFLDFDDQSDSDLSEIERFKRYAGSGEKDAYLSKRHPNAVVSMPYSDPFVTIWSTEYQVPLRKVHLGGSVPFSAMYIDDERIALWDMQLKKVICVNVIKEKVESVTKGNIGEILSHFEMWHQIGNNELLTTSEVENELVLWDLKTGNELKRFNNQRAESIISFMVSEDESTVLVALRDKSNIDAKLPAICIDLKSQKVRSTIAIDDEYVQLEPVKSVLSADGKTVYLVFWSNCIHKIDTTTGEMVLKIYYKPEGEENEAEGMTAFYCINLSNAMEYLVAYVTCHVNEEATNRLVVYDLEEHNVIAWHDAVMYKSTQLSKDGCRMLCVSTPMTEQLMTLELWDMSKVNDGVMVLLARFIPESFLRFSYLTGDGQLICCGFTGAEGVVFLRLCGDDYELKKDKKCIDVKVDLTGIK